VAVAGIGRETGQIKNKKTPASQLRKVTELMFGIQQPLIRLSPVPPKKNNKPDLWPYLPLLARAFLLSVHPSGMSGLRHR
jgi:hypothetical protein